MAVCYKLERVEGHKDKILPRPMSQREQDDWGNGRTKRHKNQKLGWLSLKREVKEAYRLCILVSRRLTGPTLRTQSKIYKVKRQVLRTAFYGKRTEWFPGDFKQNLAITMCSNLHVNPS
ncbi:hypothetical protein HPP92_003930 [Vanilla planifolia]|uniref:Uncharacterized protein n=1 Tax=Vanilla planifolia TaxID=51239 RepID=A0A835VFY9_VANPL|nr:hypothetical protein HPP92_003930 [Vanilla planifolia]